MEYDEMGGTCSTLDGINCFRTLVGKPQGKRTLWRSRSRWVDNIKVGLG